MRISITFLEKNEKPLILPIHYNEKVQGLIYRNLTKSLAEWLHDTGYQSGKRRFKLFTFSRLQGKYKVKDGSITFTGPVKLWIASPNSDILESLAIHLIRQAEITLGRNACRLVSVEVAKPQSMPPPVKVRALSPITVYSTFVSPTGKRKTYYYAPQEKEFNTLILRNLDKKVRSFQNDTTDLPPLDNASVSPVNVTNRHLTILIYKGTVIKGWRGIYELTLPEPYLSMALDAGLGAKNSQGFGMVEVVGKS